ncbi:MAG: ABC transporter ATP-binding protein [Candidatus Methanofastidiosa archaeon]|nr:ABC transporter ATP-binding protein [Candidatus Methanofastidiosa archaeon]
MMLAIIIGIISIISTGVALTSPYLYKLLVDNVLTNGEIDLLKIIIPLMILVFIVQFLLSLASTLVGIRFNNAVNLAVKRKVFEKLINKEISEILEPDVGHFQKLVEQDSGVIPGFFSGQIIGFFCSFLFAAVYFILMLIINPWLSLVSAIFIPLTILFGKYTGKNFNRINNELRQIGAGNNNLLFDTIQKWREVKAQTLENSLTDDYTKHLDSEKKANLKLMRFFALDNLFYAVKNNFVQSLLLYCIGGLFIIWGQITIGSLLMFMSYMSSFSSNIDSIINSITGFIGNRAVFERLFEVLETEIPNKPELTEEIINIDINNMNFAYNDDLPTVLHHVNYSFEFGNKFLIIGKSGEGKSTLMKLLLCMHKPSNGEILINEKNLQNIQQSSYFKHVGAVMQENKFFNLSIKENLNMIAPEASDSDIENAVKLVCLDEFIDSLPDKYDTLIGERGIKLSGGQKQRLAIARMILHKPKIAILDEATSSLDAITETKILSNLNEIFKDKSLIIISHKPALQIDIDEKIAVNKGIVTRVLQ